MPAPVRGMRRAILAGGTAMAISSSTIAGPVAIRGVVRRADSGAPVSGATVAIKRDALVGTPALETAVTDKDGAFHATAALDGDFTCEATADGMVIQRVFRNTRTPTCDFELESRLVLTDIEPRSPVSGRGPGLSFLAHSDMDLLLSKLIVRLHLTKPLQCGGPGDTQQYDLGGVIDVGFGAARGTIQTGAETFEMTGRLPLHACDESEVSLVVKPAKRLVSGMTQIVVTLPNKLVLRRTSAQRAMQLDADPGFPATYRSVVQSVTIELVTSRNSLASADLSGLTIPVGVSREQPAARARNRAR